MIWYDMVWYVLVHCVVRYEWYRRGAAKQPITGGMDESGNKQDISVKLNPAQTYLDLTKGKKLYLTYIQYIHTKFLLWSFRPITVACWQKKTARHIFSVLSKERRANEPTKGKAQFDSRVKWALVLHYTLVATQSGPSGPLYIHAALLNVATLRVTWSTWPTTQSGPNGPHFCHQLETLATTQTPGPCCWPHQDQWVWVMENTFDADQWPETI